MNRCRLLQICAMLVLCAASPVASNAQTLRVAEGDKNLVINGQLGSGATSFTRHVTLTLMGGTGTEAKPIQVRSSDLVRRPDPGPQHPPEEIIDRGNVSVGPASLKPGQTIDVPVTVNNITRHGIYDATISFWPPEQTEANAETVKLTLQVAPRVDVRLPTGASAQVAHCGILPCGFSGWLPQNLVGSKRGLLLDNQTADAVAVERQDVILRGERSGRILTAADVRPSIESNTLPAGRSAPVNLEVLGRDSIPPDRYVGTLSLGLKGASTPTAVPFTLDVRSAPWLALFVLLIGIVVGRVVKRLSTPEALLQVKLLKRHIQIKDSVRSLQSERDRAILLGRLADLRARIDSGSEAEPVLTQELDKVEVAARLLRRLEALAIETKTLANVTLRDEILSKINTAATTLLGGDAARSAQLITEIEVSLREAKEDVTDDLTESARVESALDSARDAVAAGGEVKKVFDAPAPAPPGRPTRVIAALAGSDLTGAGAQLWVRPLLFLLLLLLLTMLGLKSLYIDSGANFGAGGLYDYLGLFLWGLSAQVVQNTLQNLPEKV